ncbi:MAG: hypothetical protein BMS9Abin34_409 [Patescibacteria group bacterium]|nr:MAG: hypothetical protein BMS9Abin34_409 [Patescibacteria group bacterium]
MDEHYQVLVAPDPELLLDLFSEELFNKIVSTKLCLVVDDDGTISDSHPMYISWLARKLKRPINPKDNFRYDFLDIDPQALGMLKASVFRNARMHRNLPVIEGASEALQEIADAEVAVIILTARPMMRSMVKATRAHKEKKGIPFDLLIFSRRKKEIVQVLKRLGCHVVVVDDDPRVVAEVCDLANVTAVIFEAPYNRRLKRRQARRVKAWVEVLEIVRELIHGRG